MKRIDAVVRQQCGATILGPPSAEPWPQELVLPVEVIETFAAVDFLKPDVSIFLPFGQLQLLGKAAAIGLWRELQDFEDEDPDEFFQETDDAGKVRMLIYDRRRFPLAHDQLATSHVFIDSIPGLKGTDGQVIFNPTEASFEVLAVSPTGLFTTLANKLEQGELGFSPLSKDMGEGFQLVTRDGQQADWTMIAS